MIAAYVFMLSSVVFFVGMFTTSKEGESRGAYIFLFFMLLLMILSGSALSLDELGINPRITV